MVSEKETGNFMHGFESKGQ